MLTVYELVEGEATTSQGMSLWKTGLLLKLKCSFMFLIKEFHGMDPEVMLRSLSILVKRGKAQVFGSEGQEGVKFF